MSRDEAITWLARNSTSIKADILYCHRNRGNWCAEWMVEEDRHFRRDLEEALAAIAAPEAGEQP